LVRCSRPIRGCSTSEELVAQLPADAHMREAVRVLVDDGLAIQPGRLVGVSRAAIRFDALARVGHSLA
jgi:hypothetical protein